MQNYLLLHEFTPYAIRFINYSVKDEVEVTDDDKL